MPTPESFMEQHNLHYSTISIPELIDPYIDEMQRGLDGQPSSLLMIPSYVYLKGALLPNTPVIAVDAGGTNLRIAWIWFDENGACHIDNLQKCPMPGTTEPITQEEFFSIMADMLAPYCTKSSCISISFAYPTDILPNLDGKIVKMVKEVHISGMEGKLLGEELKAALGKKGFSNLQVCVINDSVATALAGMADKPGSDFGSFAGLIMGTGINSCYLEDLQHIGKLSSNGQQGVMVINTESGGYNQQPRTDIDIAFDHTTVDPGYHTLEKMVSGGYLGPLCLYILKTAQNEGVVLAGISKVLHLDTKDLSDFLGQQTGILQAALVDEQSRSNARVILQNMVRRAARLCALEMAGIVVKCAKTNSKVCITAEGSTIYKLPGMYSNFVQDLREYLSSQNLQAQVVEVEHAVIKGCGIAGLSHIS